MYPAKLKQSVLPTIGIVCLIAALLAVQSWLFRFSWLTASQTFFQSATSIDLLSRASGLGGILAALLTSRLIARFGVSNLFWVGSLIAVLALLGYAFSPLWAVVIIFGFVYSFAYVLIITAMNLYLLMRGSVQGLLWWYAFAGISVLPIFLNSLDWRISHLIAAGIGLFIAVLFLVTKSRWHIAVDKPKIGDLPDTFGISFLWLSLIALVLIGGISPAVSTLWPILVGNTGQVLGSNALVFWQWLVGIVSIFSPALFALIVRFVRVGYLVWVCLGVVLLGALVAGRFPLDNANFLGIGILTFAVTALFPLFIISVAEQASPADLFKSTGLLLAASNIGEFVTGAPLARTFSLTLTVLVIMILSVFIAALLLIRQIEKNR